MADEASLLPDSDAPVQPLPQPPSTGSVLFKLLLHSIVMFSLPFFTYYYTKEYLETNYDIDMPKSSIYGAVAAVVVIQGIIFSYIYQAFKEEQLERKIKALSKKKK